MFDEVLVGFDKAPSPTSSIVQGFEPVYRYAISLPPDRWFRPDGQDTVYWLSIVAVYKDAGSMTYPWGWTNHPLVSRDQQIPSPAGSKPDGAAGPVATGDADCNEGAVAARPSAGDTGDARDWTPLLDPTGRTEDLSFVLFAEPAETADSGYFIGTDPNDGSVEIVIPPSWWP